MSIVAQGLGITAAAYAYRGVIASAPAASNYPLGTKAFFTDVGINGSEMVVSASGAWVPHNGRTLLTRLTLPLVKAPTFTGTTDGAITLGTAVGTAYAKCYMYFPANSLVAAHSAGWYYTEMSSTTAAIVYNNTYTPAAGVFPTEPTSKTAFSGAVPGGAGSTAEITAFVYTVKGGLLGLYGSEVSFACLEGTNSATAKELSKKIDSTVVGYLSYTTAAIANGETFTKNIGSQARQRSKYTWLFGSSSTAGIITTINTAQDFNITLTLRTPAAATDWASLTEFKSSVEVA